MKRPVVELIIAAALLVAVFLGVRGCRDRKATGTRAVATEKVKEATPVYDSLKRAYLTKDSATVRAGTRVTEVATRPPVVPRDTMEIAGVRYVRLDDFTRLRLRNDSLGTAALAYRDTVDQLREIPPKLIAAADTVIKYQKVLIEVPSPRRRWGLGVALGPGPAYVSTTEPENGVLVKRDRVRFAKAALTLSVSYSF